MFTQIMVPLDGSALAERALPSAARLAAATGATLHLVRVVEPVPGAVSDYGPVTVPSRHLDLEARAATAYLDTIRTRLAAERVPVEVHRRLGHALDAHPARHGQQRCREGGGPGRSTSCSQRPRYGQQHRGEAPMDRHTHRYRTGPGGTDRAGAG